MTAIAEGPQAAAGRKEMKGPLDHCRRCGACCLKGGPALHLEDRELLVDNRLDLAQLITVRRGERVFWPGSATPAPTKAELVKLKGWGGDWRCLFYAEHSAGCSIYGHRPLECRVFQCWSPEALNRMIGKGTLSRSDLLHPDDPVREFILRQEQQCPANLIEELTPIARQDRTAVLELQELVRIDLSIRSQAMGKLGIAPALELFLFGRPYFIMLAPFGFAARETAEGIQLELAHLALQSCSPGN